MTEAPLTPQEKQTLSRLFRTEVRKSPVDDVPDLMDVRASALKDELSRIEAAKSVQQDDNSILNSVFPFMFSPALPAQKQATAVDADDPNACFDRLFPIGRLPTFSEC
jgi:hypothetical protein